MAHLLSFRGYHHFNTVPGLHSHGSVLSKTLSFWCALRLLQVCWNLTAKTMRKRRTHPRNDPRNDSSGELQAHQAGVSIFPYTLLCSPSTLRSRHEALCADEKTWTCQRFHRRALATCCEDISLQLA